jgi:hypothetical protein
MAILTPLDILNAAMARIGDDPLQSLEEETIGGREAQLIYENVVGFCCGVYLFSFAREMRQLSKITDAVTPDGWPHVYRLPAERLGPPIRYSDSATDPDARYNRVVLRGDTVASDVFPLFAEIKILPPPHLWSATFRETVIVALAGEIALARASDRTTWKELRNAAFGPESMNFRGGLMGAAINEDGQATPPRAIRTENNPLIAAWMS